MYSRELCRSLQPKLESYGVRTLIDFLNDDLDETMQSPNTELECQRELALRVNYTNQVSRDNPDKLVICISPHINASADGTRWQAPHGWSVQVSPQASSKTMTLADCLFDAAKSHGLSMRQPTPSQKYWKQSLYVLNRTLCPAVLTENLFMDNIDDKNFLMSDEGRHVIERIHVEGILKAIDLF